MTGKDLVLAALRGKTTPRTPWVPYTGSQIANLKGYPARDIFIDADKLLECLLEAEAQYAPDGLPVMFDLQVEAEALGCDLRWFDNSPPSVVGHPLEKELAVPDRRITPDAGRIPMIMRATEGMRRARPNIALYGLVCGPLTLASHMRGTNIFMDMYDAPDMVARLAEWCGVQALQLAEYYLEAGVDVIAAVDPLVSQISPKMFDAFLREPYRRLFCSQRESGAPGFLFVFGDATKNLEKMAGTRPDCIAIDENVDIMAARAITDAHNLVLSGNLQLTITMLLGTQAENQMAAIELMDAMGDRMFILAPGCDIPFGVPPENIIGIGQAVHNREAVRKSLENHVRSAELPAVELPEYTSLDHVLVEVVTIDSLTCAACGYMVKTAREAAAPFHDQIRVVERTIMEPENIAFMRAIGLKNLPSIVIQGEIRHVSLIPPKERLVKEFTAALRSRELP